MCYYALSCCDIGYLYLLYIFEFGACFCAAKTRIKHTSARVSHKKSDGLKLFQDYVIERSPIGNSYGLYDERENGT